jgi:hypothetical protein
MKNAVFWDVTSFGCSMNRVSEESKACVGCYLWQRFFLVRQSSYPDDGGLNSHIRGDGVA